MNEMVLTELGLPFEVRSIDIHKGERHAADFLKINPAGWVPAMKTPDGTILHETAAINLYLSDRYSPGLLSPSINEPDRGPFLSGLFYLTDELEPALKRFFIRTDMALAKAMKPSYEKKL